MLNFKRGLFSVKSNEWEAVWYFFLVLLAFAFGSSIARSIAMTLLIQHLTGDLLPYMFILIDTAAMFSLVAYANYTKKVSGLAILAFLLVSATFFTLLVRLLFFLDYPWIYGFFFVGFFLFYILISIHIGSVVAAYFTAIQLKRVTGIINAGLPIGGALGGGTLMLLLEFVEEPGWLILLTSLAYWLAFRLLYKINQRLSPVRPGHREPGSSQKNALQEFKSAFFYITHSKLMFYMAIGLMLFVIASKMLEYQYQAIIYPEMFPDQNDRAAFFALYEFLGNLIWLLMQLFLTSPLLLKLGVGASNLIHPLLMVLVSLGLFFRFGFAAGVCAQFVNQEMRGAVRTPANNLLFNAIPPSMWGTTKAFINGIIFPIATVIASSILLVTKSHLNLSEQLFLLPLLTLILSALGALLVIPQWAAYNEGVFGLLNRDLFSRKAKMGQLDNLEHMINSKLTSADSQEIIAALEMIRVVKLQGFEYMIGRLLRHHCETKVKQHCIESLAVLPHTDIVRHHLIKTLHQEQNTDTLVLLLQRLAGFKLSPGDIQVIEHFLLHPMPAVFVEACLCLHATPSYPHRHDLEKRLLARLAHPELPQFARYLQALGKFKQAAYDPVVLPFLNAPDLEIRSAAFSAHINLLQGQLDLYKDSFIDALDSPAKEMKIAALHALKECSPPADWTPIIRLLGAKERALVAESKELLRLRLNLCKTALEQQVFAPQVSVEEKFEILSLVYPLFGPEQQQRLQEQADLSLHHFIRIRGLLMLCRDLMPEQPSRCLMEKILLEIADAHLRLVITVISYLSNESREFYQRVTRGLQSESHANQGNALEVLSNAGEKYLVGRLLRYYEEQPSQLAALSVVHDSLFEQTLGLSAANYRLQLYALNHDMLSACLYHLEQANPSSQSATDLVCALLGVVKKEAGL